MIFISSITSHSDGGSSKVSGTKFSLLDCLLNFRRSRHASRNINTGAAERFQSTIINRDQISFPFDQSNRFYAAGLNSTVFQANSEIINCSKTCILETRFDRILGETNRVWIHQSPLCGKKLGQDGQNGANG